MTRTFGGRPNKMNMTVYYGLQYECACGKWHTIDGQSKVIRELPKMRLVISCANGTGAITCVKVSLLGGALKAEFGCLSSKDITAGIAGTKVALGVLLPDEITPVVKKIVTQPRIIKTVAQDSPPPLVSNNNANIDLTKVSLDPDDLFEQALIEVNEGRHNQRLWAYCFVDSHGNEDKAKALYIKRRVALLVAEKDAVAKFGENSEISKNPQVEAIPIRQQDESRDFMGQFLFILIIVSISIFLWNYYNTPINYSTTPVSKDTTTTQVQQATNAIQPATQNSQPTTKSVKPARPKGKRPTYQVDGITWRIAKTFQTRNGKIHVLDADPFNPSNRLNHVIAVNDTLITSDQNTSDFWEIEKIAKRDNGVVDVVAYGEAGAAGDAKQLMALSIMPNKQVKFSIQNVQSPEINFKEGTGFVPDIKETTSGTRVKLGWIDGKKQIAYLNGGNITIVFEDKVIPTKRDYENCEYAAYALDECENPNSICAYSQIRLESFSQLSQRMVAPIKNASFFNEKAFAQACEAVCATNIKPTPEQFAKNVCGFS